MHFYYGFYLFQASKVPFQDFGVLRRSKGVFWRSPKLGTFSFLSEGLSDSNFSGFGAFQEAILHRAALLSFAPRAARTSSASHAGKQESVYLHVLPEPANTKPTASQHQVHALTLTCWLADSAVACQAVLPKMRFQGCVLPLG